LKRFFKSVMNLRGVLKTNKLNLKSTGQTMSFSTISYPNPNSIRVLFAKVNYGELSLLSSIMSLGSYAIQKLKSQEKRFRLQISTHSGT